MLLQRALVICPVMASETSLEGGLLIFRVKLGLQISGLGCAARQAESRDQQWEQKRSILPWTRPWAV
jgi:hypothetical protein